MRPTAAGETKDAAPAAPRSDAPTSDEDDVLELTDVVEDDERWRHSARGARRTDARRAAS